MTEMAQKTYKEYTLPASIISKVDVSRLVAEAERVDDELTTAAVRARTGDQSVAQPAISDQLTSFLQQNQLLFEDGRERSELIKQLRILKNNLPVLHMTFAVASDSESLQKIAQWLRSSVHPQAVISVGLQPSLVAGVYLRTPNHVHDLSLRAKLKGQRSLLVKELRAL